MLIFVFAPKKVIITTLSQDRILRIFAYLCFGHSSYNAKGRLVEDLTNSRAITVLIMTVDQVDTAFDCLVDRYICISLCRVIEWSSQQYKQRNWYCYDPNPKL